MEHAWLACLEEAGCVGAEAGWNPSHFAFFDGDVLVGAAPAYVKTHSEGEFVFDWNWAEFAARLGIDYYPKLVFAVPFTPATGDRVLVRQGRDRGEIMRGLAHAARAVVRQAGLSSAHVLFPPGDDLAALQEGGFDVRHGIQYHWTNAGFSTFEDFLASVPQKKRTQIRRERKQPEMDGVVIRTLTPDQLTRDVAHRMYELYLTTVDKYVYGRRYLNLRFFELVRERFAHRLAWVVAEREGKIVASAFNVRSDDTLYGRYWGTDVDLPFLHFNVCFYHGIDEAIRRGLGRFNPGAGGEHKRVRGFAPTVTYSAHWIEDARMRAAISDFLVRERSHIASIVSESSAAL